MMKHLAVTLAIVLAFATAASAEENAVGHMVFFELKDKSAASKKKLVDACYKYLKDHEGVLYFSAGARAEELKAEVNAKDWDVALHIVFKDMKSMEKYLPHPQHLKFIEENKEGWKGAKVYDSKIDPNRK